MNYVIQPYNKSLLFIMERWALRPYLLTKLKKKRLIIKCVHNSKLLFVTSLKNKTTLPIVLLINPSSSTFSSTMLVRLPPWSQCSSLTSSEVQGFLSIISCIKTFKLTFCFAFLNTLFLITLLTLIFLLFLYFLGTHHYSTAVVPSHHHTNAMRSCRTYSNVK